MNEIKTIFIQMEELAKCRYDSDYAFLHLAKQKGFPVVDSCLNLAPDMLKIERWTKWFSNEYQSYVLNWIERK